MSLLKWTNFESNSTCLVYQELQAVVKHLNMLQDRFVERAFSENMMSMYLLYG